MITPEAEQKLRDVVRDWVIDYNDGMTGEDRASLPRLGDFVSCDIRFKAAGGGEGWQHHLQVDERGGNAGYVLMPAVEEGRRIVQELFDQARGVIGGLLHGFVSRATAQQFLEATADPAPVDDDGTNEDDEYGEPVA